MYGGQCIEAGADLQPPAVHLHDPRQLAQPQHLVVGQVGDVDLAEERDQVVLAQGKHVNVLDDDDLVNLLVEHSVADSVFNLVFVTLSSSEKQHF